MKIHSASPCRELLKSAYVLQLLEGSFSGQALSRKAGKSYGYTSNMIKAMLASGYLARTRKSSMLGSGGKSNLRGLSPSEYALTEKGRSLIRVVLSGGVFDVLHPGHIHFLSQAGEKGDVLVVVLARDTLVKRSKGKRPVSREEDRLLMVSSLSQVYAAVLGSDSRYSDTLERVGPDVVCLGYDQKTDLERVRGYLKETGKPIEIAMATPLPGYSTSSILDRSGSAR
jgi:cytidyltransferase-like protein